MADHISASLEDYLEAIFHVAEDKRAARPKDIAARLGVSGPSVTAALKTLAERGLVNWAPHDIVTLTEAGGTAAKDVVRRHEALRDFFREVLAVSPAEAEEAACRMEHALPAGILERILQLGEFLAVCPRGGPAFLEGFRAYCAQGHRDEDCEACTSGCLALARERKARAGDAAGPSATLGDLEPGQRGRVVRIRARGDIHRRMAEMGLTAGAVLRMERKAPLGDPIAITLKGYHLSLRGAEAAQVDVERL